MAKKTAAKKKLAPVKAKPKVQAKSAKPVKKPESKAVKSSKPAAAPPKAKVADKSSAAQKGSSSVKPALMTSKGKETKVEPKLNAKAEVEAVELTAKKTQTVVTMVEGASPEAEELQKVEKVSKIKPVKVDRGNLNDEKAKWLELNKRYGKEKAYTYKMTEKYPALVPLQHKVLGWGFVLTNENDRLEVLFENGIRMLISNYKN